MKKNQERLTPFLSHRPFGNGSVAWSRSLRDHVPGQIKRIDDVSKDQVTRKEGFNQNQEAVKMKPYSSQPIWA